MTRPCNDCQANPGDAHDEGCDVARCMLTGQQRIQCDECRHCNTCTHTSCDPDIWTGEWPGLAECREYGWWCYFGPDYGEQGWIRCEADNPRAREDLNRLVAEGTWDPEAKRWRRR